MPKPGISGIHAGDAGLWVGIVFFLYGEDNFKWADAGDNKLTVHQIPLWGRQSLRELEQVEMRIAELCRGSDAITPLFSEIVTGGGKRLRPALVLLCGTVDLPAGQELVDVAAAAELIHAASLIHDDVIDQAESRRGKPTISNLFGARQAVLYGDFLFARSFSLLTRHGFSGILEKMTQAISVMCEGEIEQSARLYDCSVSEADYMNYIYKKTAFFISVCCQSGAEAGGLPAVVREGLAAFGMQLGYAYQLTDDLLDYTGNKAITGKPALKDLAEGYLTLPVIRLLLHPHFGGRTRLIVEERDFSQENLVYIQQALHQSGILAQITRSALNRVSRAKYCLKKLPYNKPPLAVLGALADAVVLRNR